MFKKNPAKDGAIIALIGLVAFEAYGNRFIRKRKDFHKAQAQKWKDEAMRLRAELDRLKARTAAGLVGEGLPEGARSERG